MKSLFLSGLAIMVMMISAITARSTSRTSTFGTSTLTASAPYRDGLYQGKLAAEAGSPYHPATGRWANSRDRATFAAGYDQAYNAAATERAAR